MGQSYKCSELGWENGYLLSISKSVQTYPTFIHRARYRLFLLELLAKNLLLRHINCLLLGVNYPLSKIYTSVYTIPSRGSSHPKIEQICS